MLLKRGRLAATEIVELRGEKVVRKTVSMIPRIPFLSAEVDHWLAGREYRQMQLAEGIDGIPSVLGRPAPNVFFREYVEGVALPRAPAQPPEFYDRLRAIAAALHARGISHNDLHKEANVIVREDGTPALLDFQLSLTLEPDSRLHRLLAMFDLYHVAKNRRHRTGLPLTGEEEALFNKTREIRGWHRRVFKKPMNLLRRRLFPKALGKLPTDSDP